MRAVLLCEDVAHEGFLKGLARAQGWAVADAHVAPSGRGAASGWVLRQLPQRLQELRAMAADDLVLVVAVDGDNVGVAGRDQGAHKALADASVAPIGAADPLVLLVPTWSVDTWAVYFCRDRVVYEGKSAKSQAKGLFMAPHPGFRAPGVPAEDAPRFWRPADLKSLVEGFLGDDSPAALPSLAEARRRWALVV